MLSAGVRICATSQDVSQNLRRAQWMILYLKNWCCWRELNSRPLPYQGSALPLSYSSAGEGAFRHKLSEAQEHSGRFFHSPVQMTYGREKNIKEHRVGAGAGRPVESRFEGKYGATQGAGKGTVCHRQ